MPSGTERVMYLQECRNNFLSQKASFENFGCTYHPTARKAQLVERLLRVRKVAGSIPDRLDIPKTGAKFMYYIALLLVFSYSKQTKNTLGTDK